MSIFALGFLKGMADQYSETKGQEAKAKAEKEKEERMHMRNLLSKEADWTYQSSQADAQRAFTTKEREANEEFQIKTADTANKNNIMMENLRSANQMSNTLTQMKQQFIMDSSKMDKQAALDINKQIQILEAERNQKLNILQDQLGQFYGYMDTATNQVVKTPNANTRPLNATEIKQLTGVMLLPQTLTYVKKTESDGAGANYLNSLGHNPIGGTQQASKTDYVGQLIPYTKPDGTTTRLVMPAFNDDMKSEAQVRAVQGVELGFQAISEQNSPGFFKQVMEDSRAGDNTRLDQLKNNIMLAAKSTQTFNKGMQAGGGSNKDFTVYNNPAAQFAGVRYFEDPALQKDFEENLLKPLMVFNEENMKKAFGAPKELNVKYDSNGNFVIPNDIKWRWATREVPGSGGMRIYDPEIHLRAVKVAKATGKDVEDILYTVKEAADPIKALDALNQRREAYNTLAYDAEKNLTITPQAVKFLQDRLVEQAYETVNKGLDVFEREFEFTRALTNRSDTGKRPKTLKEYTSVEAQKAEGSEALRKKMGIDRDDAIKRQRASSKTYQLAKAIFQMVDSEKADAGLYGNFIKIVGSGVDIAVALKRSASDFNMSDAARERFLGSAEKLNSFTSEFKDGKVMTGNDLMRKVGDQSVMDLMGEQLAFSFAAALHGGKQGREITNQDVDNARRVLGLDTWKTGNTSVKANMQHIMEVFGRQSVILDKIANSRDTSALDAAFMYDKATSNLLQGMEGVDLLEQALGDGGIIDHSGGQTENKPLMIGGEEVKDPFGADVVQ